MAKESLRNHVKKKQKVGRKKNIPNLKRLDNGNMLNQHGIEFTSEEKKALESMLRRTNYKRKKMLEEESKLPRFAGGLDTGDKVGSLQTMNKESDFIIARRYKSLQSFESKTDYNEYMKRLEYVNSPTYVDDRVKLYKRNHMKAIENAFGDEGKDVVMKIRMMKPKDYMELIQKDEELEISYIYDPSEASAKLNRIRAGLGMKLKEDYMFEE